MNDKIMASSMARGLIIYLEDISQTFFLRNALFGALLLALFLYFDPIYFAFGVFGSLVGYGYTHFYSVPKLLRDSGLITINGFFFGIGVASLYQDSPVTLLGLVLGSLFMPLAVKGAFEILQHWKLSPFVIPYLVSIGVLVVCGDGLLMERRWDIWPAYIHDLPSFHTDGNVVRLLTDAIGMSIGRLMFVPNVMFGAAILTLVTVFSPRRGLYLFAGTVVGTVIAGLISRGYAWEYGFLSFSAGLVGLGLAARPERLTFLTILLFCAISSVLTIALEQVFRSAGIPVLSLPFVLTMWMAILSRSPRFNVSWEATASAR